MIDNICETVLMNNIFHIIAGKNILSLDFEREEYLKIQEIIQKNTLNELRTRLYEAVKVLVRDYFENDEQLQKFLYIAVDNISVRIKNAADNERLSCIF